MRLVSLCSAWPILSLCGALYFSEVLPWALCSHGRFLLCLVLRYSAPSLRRFPTLLHTDCWDLGLCRSHPGLLCAASGASQSAGLLLGHCVGVRLRAGSHVLSQRWAPLLAWSGGPAGPSPSPPCRCGHCQRLAPEWKKAASALKVGDAVAVHLHVRSWGL